MSFFDDFIFSNIVNNKEKHSLLLSKIYISKFYIYINI